MEQKREKRKPWAGLEHRIIQSVLMRGHSAEAEQNTFLCKAQLCGCRWQHGWLGTRSGLGSGGGIFTRAASGFVLMLLDTVSSSSTILKDSDQTIFKK